MTRPIGFSTGALARGDFRRGLEMILSRRIIVAELSALREEEFEPLLAALPSLDLSCLEYISIHAPSRWARFTEGQASEMLRSLVPKQWPIVVHPEAITSGVCWVGFGDRLCIENMDQRKETGRTVAELERLFERYPDASFCFDIGHARQVDPTMSEAGLLVRRFGNRLRQVHMSDVGPQSQHDALSESTLQSFRKVADLIPPGVPIVLETAIADEQIAEQIRLAAAVFTRVGTR